MKVFALFLALGLGLCGARDTHAFKLPIPQISYGHYQGQLTPHHGKFQIRANLDLFAGQFLDQAARTSAILKLTLGHPDEGEFVSYFYSSVGFSFDDSVFTFTQEGNSTAEKSSPLRMVLKASKNKLEGAFELLSDGTKGEVVFALVAPFPQSLENHGPQANTAQMQKSAPTSSNLKGLELLVQAMGKSRTTPSAISRSALPSLSGVYDGFCGKSRAQLFLQNFGRFGEKANRAEDPLTNYDLIAAIGFQNCPEGSVEENGADKPFCVTANFTSGHFSIGSGELRLKGAQGSFRCDYESKGWQCECQANGCKKEKCHFQSKAQFTAPQREPVYDSWIQRHQWHMEKLEEPDSLPWEDDVEPQDLQGDYLGYLYLQQRERLQIVKLSLLAAKATPNAHNPERLFLIPSLTLYLGAPQKREQLIYGFEKRPFLLTTPQLVFSGENDALLQVNSWTQGILEGLYFSKSHGLIGPVVLMKGRMPMPSVKLETLPEISGNYENKDWNFQLNIGSQQATGLIPQWLVEGVMESTKGIVASPIIESGSYDASTGYLSLNVEDPDPKRVRRKISGHFNADNSLSLWIPHRITVGMPMPKVERLHFKRGAP